jgi:hypothetical protein
MNSKLVLDAAERIARDLSGRTDLTTDDARLNDVYRRLIGRPPAAREQQLARAYLAGASWGDYLHVLLCTNEFIYVE